jgi:hypothetical protein
MPHNMGHAFRVPLECTADDNISVFLDEFGFDGCAQAMTAIRDAVFGEAQPCGELSYNGSGGGDNKRVFLLRKQPGTRCAWVLG